MPDDTVLKLPIFLFPQGRGNTKYCESSVQIVINSFLTFSGICNACFFGEIAKGKCLCVHDFHVHRSPSPSPVSLSAGLEMVFLR